MAIARPSENQKIKTVTENVTTMISLWRTTFLETIDDNRKTPLKEWLTHAGEKDKQIIPVFFADVAKNLDAAGASEAFAEVILPDYYRNEYTMTLDEFFTKYPDILNYFDIQFNKNPHIVEAGVDFENFKNAVIEKFFVMRKLWCAAFNPYHNYTQLESWLDDAGKKYKDLIHSFGEDVRRTLSDFDAVDIFKFAFNAPINGLDNDNTMILNNFFENYPEILIYFDKQFKQKPMVIQAGKDFADYFATPVLKNSLYLEWKKTHKPKISEVKRNAIIEFYTQDKIYTLTEEEYNKIYERAVEENILPKKMSERIPADIPAVLKVAMNNFLLDALNEFHTEIWAESGPNNRGHEKDWKSWADFEQHNFFKPIQKLKDEFPKEVDFKDLPPEKLNATAQHLHAELLKQKVSFFLDKPKDAVRQFNDYYLDKFSRSKPR